MRRMRIVIAGGTGFLGVPRAETSAEEGHDVRVLTRQLKPGESRHDPGTGVPGVTRIGWRPDGRAGAVTDGGNGADAGINLAGPDPGDGGRGGAVTDVVNGADAVINLSGANLGDARWTPQRKAVLHDSRILPTRTLVAAITESSARTPVFVSASGVGYYRAGSEAMTESSPSGNDFLAEL